MVHYFHDTVESFETLSFRFCVVVFLVLKEFKVLFLFYFKVCFLFLIFFIILIAIFDNLQLLNRSRHLIIKIINFPRDLRLDIVRASLFNLLKHIFEELLINIWKFALQRIYCVCVIYLIKDIHALLHLCRVQVYNFHILNSINFQVEFLAVDHDWKGNLVISLQDLSHRWTHVFLGAS